jgi:ABC-type transporter Mla MlaB component
MSVHAIRAQQQTRLIFDGALTIYEAGQVREALTEIIESEQPVEVDLTGISEIDLSGIQLLLTLLREPRLKFLAGASTAVSTALTLLDLQDLFWPKAAAGEH